MRGKARKRVFFWKSLRITPAYAGKSFLHPRRRRMQKDHPRLCGEKFKIAFVLFALSGSPPPMRGKVFLAPLVLSVIRITPAYAGKSSVFPRSSVILEDHPRLCGEKAAGHRTRQGNPGSPPPMRGKAQGTALNRERTRITPAYAGKSDVAQSVAQQTKDHPRLCGEKNRREFFV